MTVPTPATLRRQAKPFDDPDWVFELKHDGFRALAIVELGKARFVSRNGSRIHGIGPLANEVSRTVRAESAVLDGEIAVSHKTGGLSLPDSWSTGRRLPIFLNPSPRTSQPR